MIQNTMGVVGSKSMLFDTMGVVGSKSMLFLRDLGRRIRATSNDPKSFIYLLRRLAVTVQRGNAISILGTIA